MLAKVFHKTDKNMDNTSIAGPKLEIIFGLHSMNFDWNQQQNMRKKLITIFNRLNNIVITGSYSEE